MAELIAFFSRRDENYVNGMLTVLDMGNTWHGAARDSWFQHLAVEVAGENVRNEWCEAVSDEEYKLCEG